MGRAGGCCGLGCMVIATCLPVCVVWGYVQPDDKPFEDDFEYLLLIFCIHDVCASEQGDLAFWLLAAPCLVGPH